MSFMVVDFEAEKDLSGRYFPIEVGLCRPGDRPMSSLICPRPDWLADDRALFNAELLHAAQTNGKAADFIVGRFHRLTAGVQLVSDAAFFDQRLMGRLGLNQELLEFFPLVERLAQAKGVVRAALNQWINQIDGQRTTSHRAGEDAWVRAELLGRVLRCTASQ
jgi:hypothetical protein